MSKIRILHLIPDEKFLDDLIIFLDQFIEIDCEYYIYNCRSAQELKWHRRSDRVGFAPFGSETANQLFQHCQDGYYQGVIFHACPTQFPQYVERCGDIPKILVIWGHGDYGMISFHFYLKKTQSFLSSYAYQGSIIRMLEYPLGRLKHWLTTRPFYPINPYVRASCRHIDYYAPVWSADYELLTKAYPTSSFGPELPFQYVVHISDEPHFHHTLGSVLLNNSSTPTGNHLDVLSRLYTLSVCQPIIAPLNYGETGAYRARVHQEGLQLFGDQWQPLMDFIPKNDYFTFLGRCSHLVMGHLRQQALANIFWGLSEGLKCYFWKDSVVFRQLIKQGFVVYSLDDATPESFREMPTLEEQKRNRILLIDQYGKDAMRQKFEKLFSVLRNAQRSRGVE